MCVWVCVKVVIFKYIILLKSTRGGNRERETEREREKERETETERQRERAFLKSAAPCLEAHVRERERVY